MSSGALTVVSALARAVSENPGSPLVTFYDGATGERVELSALTFDNWVNKIANLLSDELLFEPGEVIRVDLPTHWQSTVTLLAAWTAGLQVSLGPEPAPDAAVSVVGPAVLADPGSVTGQPIACSLRPLGGPFLNELPMGWLDFAREVPGQPDLLVAPSSGGPEEVALDAVSGPVRHRELVERALMEADRLGLVPGGRLITDANPAARAGVIPGLVAPLVSGSSVVLVVGCDAPARAAIADQERVTASSWLSGSEIATAGAD